MNKVYGIIQQKIVDQLENGTVPWQKPWLGGAGMMPKNLISNKPYRGINILLLGSAGYTNPYWVSKKQCLELKGRIKREEFPKSSIAVFWKINKFAKENDDGDDETWTSRILRFYQVWNVDQCEGITHKRVMELREGIETREFNPIEECEEIVAKMPNPPSISNGVQQAYYRPSNDSVNMPAKNSFVGDAEYYSTLFHELSHSTGHDSRLGRHKRCPHHISRVEYSKEELVAEMGAAFLCGIAGIEERTIDNSAAYIKGWLGALKNDETMVVMAAAAAQKTADYIQGITWN